jgi:hypothetical protein
VAPGWIEAEERLREKKVRAAVRVREEGSREEREAERGRGHVAEE